MQSRGLGDVYKRQPPLRTVLAIFCHFTSVTIFLSDFYHYYDSHSIFWYYYLPSVTTNFEVAFTVIIMRKWLLSHLQDCYLLSITVTFEFCCHNHCFYSALSDLLLLLGVCYYNFRFLLFLLQHLKIYHYYLTILLLFSPRSGELRTQKLKSHLLRTQSLKVLPVKPAAGQYVAIRATLTARDFFLANLYPSGPLTCTFFF